MKKTVGIDHFGHFLNPCALQSCGGDIYFLQKRVDMQNNKYLSDLHLWRGASDIPLTATGDVGCYALLGQEVYFVGLRDKKDKEAAEKGLQLSAVYHLPAYGEAQELCRLDMAVEKIIMLSRERFLFVAAYDAHYNELLAEHGAKGLPEALEEDAACQVFDELPFWMNGDGVTNKKRSRLYLYDAGEITAVTDETTMVESVSLSPDGLFAVICATPFTHVMGRHNRLLRLELDCLALGDITPMEETTYHLHSHIDGENLLFAAKKGLRYGMSENNAIYRLHIPTGRCDCLYDGGMHTVENTIGCDIRLGGALEMPLYAKNGNYYFISTLGEHARIMRASLQGGEPEAINDLPGAVCEFVPHGQGFACVALRDLAGAEIYTVSLDGAETRQSDFNTALAREYPAGKLEPLSITGEKGWEVRGYVLLPANHEPGKKYPAIVDIHGGPKTAYGYTYFHEMQYWAGQGYAVIFCNPTGSCGRGDAFADIRGAYGTVDYRDIMAFLDKALETFDCIDENRLGVTGGSYGGFMTNWIIGHTKRFKCAASQRSISNWLSFFGVSDIGYFFAADQNAATPWSDAAHAWEQSPLKYANEATTPTLFIHSDQDYRCPQEEGLQMFSALKYHGVPTRLCLFRGENHELSRSGKPKNRVRRLREITDWMNRYLKNE